MYGQNNMNNQYNMNNQNSMNNQYSNNNYNQPNNNGGVKQKNGFFGTILLILLLGVAVVGLLQLTNVIDVTVMFEDKTSQKDDGDKKTDKDKENEATNNETSNNVEKSEKDRLANLCQTYNGQINDGNAYVNGRVVSSNDSAALTGIIDEDGMIKSGEVCMSTDGTLNCIIADDKNYYVYVCNNNEYNEITRSEVKANLLISTACSLVDNNGNYTNPTNNTSCSNYTCTVNVDGKDYSKSCR